ncbi:MAG: cytochrome c biogenesis protein CcsA [Chloroflexi bacterium]|nr:cytochrome c biogenesis protein CcsA [Chloroflexota bacterium]
MKGKGFLSVLFGLCLVLMVWALYAIFVTVPTEKEMGIVQRIFYLMVPMGWLALLSFVVIFICSIFYLKTRERKWDILSYSAAELGLFATSATLIVGATWAKAIWGVWWTWEARLTATLILWLIYLAYFMVRSFAPDENRGAQYAAVVGILGLIDIPIVALATTLWRGLHPPPLIFQGGLHPAMLATLLLSIAAFTALYVVLLIHRVSAKNSEIEIRQLKQAEV